MMKRPLLLIVSGTFGLLMSFQNCSNAKLTKAFDAKILYKSGKIEMCLDQSLLTYTLDTSMAVNLNIVNTGRTITEDSDGDGLSDEDEVRYGFDPLKRRSDDRILDKVCLDLTGTNNCANIATSCTKTPNQLGLTDCELDALGLNSLYQHPDQGLDSDKDGMIDLIELRAGTAPNQIDHLDDPDNDLLVNIDEISLGSNIRYYDQPFDERYSVKTTVTKKSTGTPACAGELWEMDIAQFPWFKGLRAMTDDMDGSLPAGALSFTRPQDANLALIVVKLRPKNGETGNAKIYFRSLIIDDQLSNLDGTLSSFQLAGEVQP